MCLKYSPCTFIHQYCRRTAQSHCDQTSWRTFAVSFSLGTTASFTRETALKKNISWHYNETCHSCGAAACWQAAGVCCGQPQKPWALMRWWRQQEGLQITVHAAGTGRGRVPLADLFQMFLFRTQCFIHFLQPSPPVQSEELRHHPGTSCPPHSYFPFSSLTYTGMC